MSKSKVEISKLDTFCQGLNATVPHPKTNEENKNYLDALKTRNITSSVAVRSYHGIVELHSNGFWNPFPTETSLNAVCETESFVHKTRTKRQASSGNKFLSGYHCVRYFFYEQEIGCEIRLEIIPLVIIYYSQRLTVTVDP